MVRKRKNAHIENEETHFEKKPRFSKSHEKNVKLHHLLPIKVSSGKIIKQSYEEKMKPTEQSDSDFVENLSQTVPVKPLKSKEELLTERRKIIHEKREKIAHLSSTIVSNPQSNLKMIKELRLMLDERDSPESFATVQKLVVASLGCVFVDIIPGYRIRERTEKEKEVKLSKEVKALTDFEEGLLHHYQLYLKRLEKLIKNGKKAGNFKFISADATRSLGRIAATSLTQLYIHTSHFNFHANIALVIVPIANNDPDPEVRKMCCDAISSLFATDKQGSPSLVTVKAIVNVVKERGPKQIHPEFLNTLLSLRIKVVDYSMVGIAQNKEERKKMKEEKKKMSRREKKETKKHKDIDQELKEIAATEDQNERIKMNTEMVQQIFLIYFRILKHKGSKLTDCQVILPSVLEGLAKFAHLINVDFFNDLLLVLQQLVTSETLATRENLHCIFTAFQILSGQGEVLNIDPIEFYRITYKIIHEIAAEQTGSGKDQKQDIDLLLKCIDLMLNKRRKQVTLTSLCAFIKRLSALSLQMKSTQHTVRLLKHIGRLLNSNSRTQSLFDVESLSIGNYDPEMDDPVHSGSQSTVLWDLHLMRRHYASLVGRSAGLLLKKS